MGKDIWFIADNWELHRSDCDEDITNTNISSLATTYGVFLVRKWKGESNASARKEERKGNKKETDDVTPNSNFWLRHC